jgi:thiol:disulfide interchange protein DsbA
MIKSSCNYLLVVLFASSFFLTQVAYAENKSPSNPYAGKYELVTPPQPTSTPDKVEIVELFWYRCPHCYSLDKFLRKTGWLQKKPDYVEFTHMPAVFDKDNWIPLAKAYYVAESLGVLDKVHLPIFEAIHDKRRNLNSEQALQKLFNEYGGVNSEEFTKTYNSFAIETKINRAKDMTTRYGINGVPVVIVNGKYRLNSEKADGYENMMLVMDYLIEKEHTIMTAAHSGTAPK